MQFPKPRYRLATLLLAMTAVAIALWGIPEWREYQRRMEFEAAVKQLKVGVQQDSHSLLPPHARQIGFHTTDFPVPGADPAEWRSIVVYPYQRRWYCIVFVERATFSAVPAVSPATRKIFVYRLAPAPRNYQAQTKHVRDSTKRAANSIGLVPLGSREQYILDFLQLVAGIERLDQAIRYELIHADPPINSDFGA